MKKRFVPWLLAALLIVLVLVALVAVRLYGWSGQREEGQLQFTVLVNPWNAVDSVGYRPKLTQVQGVEVDESCAASLEAMLNDCRAAGNAPLLGRGYISRAELAANPDLSGESEDPSFSEHPLGLAVDIQDENSVLAASSQVLAWMRENAWKYGFVLRYPDGSEEKTGVPAYAWHFRYVGTPAASQIQQLNITLEEYVSMFYNDAAEVVFEK